MKVAIIGAGIAGLSCALELERHGVQPTIYEVNSFIGEQFSHVGVCLETVVRSLGDPIIYFRDKLGIDIKPLNNINSLVQHSPNKTTVIKGNHGYLLKRSKESDDIKVQIHSKLRKSNILFNTYGDYASLSKQNDYVIIANGQSNFTNELGCWFEWVNTQVRGAIVLGDFDPNAVILWLNNDYCKNGYAYLSPFSNKKASLILVVTDINEKEIDHFWELFIYTENIKYTIVEEFTLPHKSGHVYPLKVGNILFAGNSAGAIDPFLGFGVLSSLTTGVKAARSIVKNKDYEKLIREILDINSQLYQFRKAINKVNNEGYDKIIAAIGLPGIKDLIYHSPFNVVKYGSFVLKLISKDKKG